MSDMMKPPMGKGGSPIKNNLSMFNPADMAAMAQGDMGQALVGAAKSGKELTIEDGLNMMGLKSTDPLQKLIDFGGKQMQNANPMTKMKNIAAESGGGKTAPNGPPQEGNEFDQLMNSAQ